MVQKRPTNDTYINRKRPIKPVKVTHKETTTPYGKNPQRRPMVVQKGPTNKTCPSNKTNSNRKSPKFMSVQKYMRVNEQMWVHVQIFICI